MENVIRIRSLAAAGSRLLGERTRLNLPVGPVIHSVRVEVISQYRPDLINRLGKNPLDGTRRVKGGNGLCRYCDGNCQGDQDGCRRLEFPFCEIKWFYTP